MYYVSMHCFEGKLIHFPGSYQEALVGSGVQFPKNNVWRCALCVLEEAARHGEGQRNV